MYFWAGRGAGPSSQQVPESQRGLVPSWNRGDEVPGLFCCHYNSQREEINGPVGSVSPSCCMMGCVLLLQTLCLFLYRVIWMAPRWPESSGTVLESQPWALEFSSSYFCLRLKMLCWKPCILHFAFPEPEQILAWEQDQGGGCKQDPPKDRVVRAGRREWGKEISLVPLRLSMAPDQFLFWNKWKWFTTSEVSYLQSIYLVWTGHLFSQSWKIGTPKLRLASCWQ